MYIYHIVCSTSIVGGSVCYHRRAAATDCSSTKIPRLSHSPS